MKLKRLDIHGFKSFYHRTTVAFDDGVTAIVGPNGCGKSNIVDSIKWVMGEQGPKALRGGAMEDVIFAGSAQRGPMGMCEVKLTFHNDGTAEVPARWREVEEVAIERRLERSRGSAYRVNKQRCRLADIQDLIAGTGVGSGPGGRRAYAIIEQGQIGRLVSARADERRLLIEEAAGITRYRDRRRLAEKKMKETRLNLERIDDVIGEVERQVRSLRRQAKKAERFRAYKTEAREIALRAATFEWLRLDADRRHLEGVVTAAEIGEIDSERALELAETRHQTATLAERDADAAARSAADALRRAEDGVRQSDAELELHERERSSLGRQLETAHADRALGAERLTELEREQAAAAERVATLEAEAEGDAGLVAEADTARRVAARALLEARAEAEKLRRMAAEEAQAIARARAQEDSARREAMDLRERAAMAGEERQLLASQSRQLDEQAEALSRAADAVEAEIVAAEAEEKAAIALRAEHRAAADAAAADERRIAERIAADRSRLRSLVELERKREGLGEGIRAVLDAGLDGVVGPVPAVLDVPADLEQAVASVLDARIKGAVVKDLNAALGAIEHLRGRGRGRGIFALVEGPPEFPVAEAPDVPGVRGRLVDLVPGGAYPALVARLLSDALVVDDIAAARAARAAGWLGALVTPDGTCLDGRGLVIGGAEGADPAPLSRRREIRELEGQLEEAAVARGEAHSRLEEARAAADLARNASRHAAQTAQKGRMRRIETRKDTQRVTNDRERLAARIRRLEADVEQLSGRAWDAESRALDAADAVAAAEEGRTDRARAIATADEAVQAAEAGRDEAVATLHRIQGAAMARKERVGGARAALSRLDRQVRDTRARAAKAEVLRQEIEERLVELGALSTAAEARRAQARADAELLGSALGEARAQHAEAQGVAKEAQSDVVAARKGRDAARDAVGEGRLALRTCLVRIEAAEDKLRDRYHVTLGEIVTDFHQSQPPGPEEKERLVQLEGLLEKIGDVNVGAIEEYEAVAERFEFLTSQRADLTEALDDLTTAIEQIDQTSRRLFAETFEAVNGHFVQLFPRLFRGGSAQLTLTNPEDLLGTGIEMHVSPPGKKVQSVTLLSGGEKAMCALALVFAVFRFKPSPFCLLDEVDAPLDDANIGRFNEVVREMAETSQVVLITHNKRTMEIADVLYGITMEESGISKLVSVRMT